MRAVVQMKNIEPRHLTWVSLMPVLIIALECGTVEGRAQAKRQLMELAKQLDEANEESEQ